MKRPLGIQIVLALVCVGASACGSDSTAPSSSSTALLVGTYDLVSITFPGQPTLSPPAATGELRLHDSTYALTITLPEQGTTPDSGTYTINGNHWSQSSVTNPVQSVGTYTLSNDTLSVDLTEQGLLIENVWKKRSGTTD
jgi:hypothetical protein